jgi:hypothetical protein
MSFDFPVKCFKINFIVGCCWTWAAETPPQMRNPFIEDDPDGGPWQSNS